MNGLSPSTPQSLPTRHPSCSYFPAESSPATPSKYMIRFLTSDSPLLKSPEGSIVIIAELRLVGTDDLSWALAEELYDAIQDTDSTDLRRSSNRCVFLPCNLKPSP